MEFIGRSNSDFIRRFLVFLYLSAPTLISAHPLSDCRETLVALAMESFNQLSETIWIPQAPRKLPESWDFDGPGSSGYYGLTFSESLKVVGMDSFESMLFARRQSKSSTHVLDLFGSGFFIDDQRLATSITGLRLAPYNRIKLGSYPEKDVPVEVTGDANDPLTWHSLSQSMNQRGIPSFDLIIMRPDGAWRSGAFFNRADRMFLAMSFIIYQTLLRISETGYFFFNIPVSTLMEGDFSKRREWMPIVENVARLSRHRLILLSDGHKDYSAQMNGILIPVAAQAENTRW